MSQLNGDGTHDRVHESPVNGCGAVCYLQSLPGSEGLLSKISGGNAELCGVIVQVLEELYLSDAEATREILNFLVTLSLSRASIGTSLSEIAKFSVLEHRNWVRQSLHEFEAATLEELTNPDVLSEAGVLRRWLRIYARNLTF